jgi:O-antigen ligase
MLFSSDKIINHGLILSRVGFSIVALLFFVVFLSKPLMNLFSATSLLLSFFYIFLYEKDFLLKNKYLLLFIPIYLIGFLLSFLSKSDENGVFSFLGQFRFMLLILPLAVFVRKKNQLNIVLGILFLSATISIFYGIYDEQPYGLFRGFHSLGRTADMMIIVCLSALVFFVQGEFYLNKKSILIKSITVLLVAFFTWAILMSEMRGSWLGFFIGGILFLLLMLIFKRKLLALTSISLISFVIILMYTGNIGDIKNKLDRINGQIESIFETENNYSNEARLHLWVTGLDFSKEHFLFGTGTKNAEKMFKAFFHSQPEKYQQKYRYAMDNSNSFHNSYIQIIVETGIIFFTLFITSIFYIFFIIIKNMNKVKREEQKYLVAAIVTSSAFMSVQVFHNELYSYGSTPFYLLLFSACFILNENDNSIWFKK